MGERASIGALGNVCTSPCPPGILYSQHLPEMHAALATPTRVQHRALYRHTCPFVGGPAPMAIIPAAPPARFISPSQRLTLQRAAHAKDPAAGRGTARAPLPATPPRRSPPRASAARLPHATHEAARHPTTPWPPPPRARRAAHAQRMTTIARLSRPSASRVWSGSVSAGVPARAPALGLGLGTGATQCVLVVGSPHARRCERGCSTMHVVAHGRSARHAAHGWTAVNRHGAMHPAHEHPGGLTQLYTGPISQERKRCCSCSRVLGAVRRQRATGGRLTAAWYAA